MPSLDAISSSSAWRGKVPGVVAEFRTIIAYRAGDCAVFIYGFAKNQKDNISAADEQDMAQTGALLLGLDADGIETLIVEGELWEVACDDED